MQTEAIFENIAERIQREISAARNSVFIAVAWFTNKNLFKVLVQKARSGCVVALIVSDDEINRNAFIDFEELNIGDSRVYKIGNGDTKLMHNKFCVVDHNTVITGSYNWSYKVETNFENVIITSGDTALAEQFVSEFNAIRRRYYPDAAPEEVAFPLDKIMKRLEILKNYILLEELEELQKGAAKLEQYNFNEELAQISEAVRKQEFASAITKIQAFISANQQLSVWTDPEIAALKLQIKNLENQLNAYDNERTELEKILTAFQHRHVLELGDLITEILKLRKLKFKNDKEKFEEAEADEQQYKEQVDTEKQKVLFEISDAEKADLKKDFRKATMLCHPDKFSNESVEDQRLAEEIFKDLNEANAKNDFKRVAEILANLERGILSTVKGDRLFDTDKLRATVDRLKSKIKILEGEIMDIKQSETFQTVNEIEDWDAYFEDIKKQLEREVGVM